MAALARVTEASKKLYRDKIAEVRSYVKSRSLPKDLQRRVVRYYKHFMQKRTPFKEAAILDELSSFLRNEIAVHLVNDTVYHVPMFRFIVTKDPYFITKLLVLLKPMCCAPGDYVMHAGEIGP